MLQCVSGHQENPGAPFTGSKRAHCSQRLDNTVAISGIGGQAANVSVTSNVQERAQKLLEQMDGDEDGKVSKRELTAYGDSMKANGARRLSSGEVSADQAVKATGAPSADALFAKADTDGDGSLSIENLSAMMSEHETHAAARGGPPPGGPPPGGPPPGGPRGGGGGAPGGAANGASSSDSASSSSAASSDPADAKDDGLVSAAEKLIYELSHPEVALDQSSLG
jgi:EF hand